MWKRGWLCVWPKSAEDLRVSCKTMHKTYIYKTFIGIILYIMHVCMFTSMNACQGVCIHSLHMQHMHVHALVLVLTPRSILGASCIPSIARRIPIPTTSEVHKWHFIAWHHTRVHCSAVDTVQYGKIDWVTECIEMMHYLGSLKAIWFFLIGSYTAWGNYWELPLILFGKASFCLNPRSFSKSLRFVALFWVLKILCLASTLQHIMYRQVSADFPFEK